MDSSFSPLRQCKAFSIGVHQMRLREGYTFGSQQFINRPLCCPPFRLNPAHDLLDPHALLPMKVIGSLLCHRSMLFRQRFAQIRKPITQASPADTKVLRDCRNRLASTSIQMFLKNLLYSRTASLGGATGERCKPCRWTHLIHFPSIISSVVMSTVPVRFFSFG